MLWPLLESPQFQVINVAWCHYFIITSVCFTISASLNFILIEPNYLKSYKMQNWSILIFVCELFFDQNQTFRSRHRWPVRLFVNLFGWIALVDVQNIWRPSFCFPFNISSILIRYYGIIDHSFHKVIEIIVFFILWI